MANLTSHRRVGISMRTAIVADLAPDRLMAIEVR